MEAILAKVLAGDAYAGKGTRDALRQLIDGTYRDAALHYHLVLTKAGAEKALKGMARETRGPARIQLVRSALRFHLLRATDNTAAESTLGQIKAVKGEAAKIVSLNLQSRKKDLTLEVIAHKAWERVQIYR